MKAADECGESACRIRAERVAGENCCDRRLTSAERELTPQNFPRKLPAMPNANTFESFEKELRRLVAKFERGLAEFKNPGYLEAQLRDDFLSPFFAALGWDLQNNAGLIQSHREVEIESRTGSGRADYLFRPDRKPRFVCEAKKPAEELHGGYAMQAKRYAWTIGVRLAVLSDFEELKIYVVTGNPDKGEPDNGLWRSYHHSEYIAKAQELWDLLTRDNVASGNIERALESLPKKLRPNRTKDFDEEFLTFLDGVRRSLASDLIRNNDRADLLEGTKLNEAVQCIIDAQAACSHIRVGESHVAKCCHQNRAGH